MSGRSIGAIEEATGIAQCAVGKSRWAVPAFRDLLFAISCLIILGPLLVLAATAVLLESGWPIFFTQIRVGKNGTPFRLYKFRKFHKCAAGGGGALTLRNDPRLTNVGRFLERTKLDELPQLWNVLKGDMSIVGPRPESLHFANCFGNYARLLDFKPGIFGPAQAIFRNEGELHAASLDPETMYREVLFPTKARIDLAYYPKRTAMRDMGWIMLGVLAVVGWTQVPQMGRNTARELEDWVGGRQARRATAMLDVATED